MPNFTFMVPMVVPTPQDTIPVFQPNPFSTNHKRYKELLTLALSVIDQGTNQALAPAISTSVPALQAIGISRLLALKLDLVETALLEI